MSILIVCDPSNNRIIVVKAIDPDDGALMVGGIAFNAVLAGHANTYEEACQICKDINDGVITLPY